MAKKRKSIPQPEAERLWAAAAGRCCICNTSLLRDDMTGVEVKAGEKAHIVGISDEPRSPRGRHPLPKSARNTAKNLILLCEKHHTEVDTRPDLYTVEHIHELKRKFEERIFFLTSLSPERRTLVLRLIGNVHGQKLPDLSREQAREAVLHEEGRYPRFDLASSEHDYSIDLRDLTNEGETAYWAEATRRVQRRVGHLDDLRREGAAGHVSVLALARIPILVTLGAGLGDAGDVTVYHRRNDAGWGWDPDANLPEFELVEHKVNPDDSGVILMCSVTAPVQIERVPEELAAISRYEIRPVHGACGPTVLDHPGALAAFRQAYRRFLSTLETAHPACDAIHLVPAVPADAAVALGQIRTPAANPSLRVYDLEGDRYLFACEVGR